ncbi:MAG: hypothetical protein AAF512_23425, partial [Pseudomonadota bacterium]
TLSIVSSFAFGLLFIAILFWVYRQLSTSESLELLAQASYSTEKPKIAYIAGSTLLVLGVSFYLSLLNGESAQKAKVLAQEQLGPEFQYHVSSISISGMAGRASVTAYNEKEIKHIQVQW